MKINELIEEGEFYIKVDNDEYKLQKVEEIKEPSIKTSMSIKGHIDIIEKTKKNRIIAGYASVAVIDSDDHLVPLEALRAGIETLLKDPNYANIMVTHQNIQIGKIIQHYGELETHVDERGLFIVAEIRSDIRTSDIIWESILNKEINGFSIGCEVIERHEECDAEKCIMILDKINIFEVSVCSQPINKDCGFLIISKSKFESEFPNESVCNICEKMVDNMGKKDAVEKSKDETTDKKIVEASEESKDKKLTETKKENTDETSDVTEEKGIDTTIIEEMSRRITAMEEIIQELAKKAKDDPEEDEEEEDDMKKKETKSKDDTKQVKDEKKSEEDSGLEVKIDTSSIDALRKSIDTLIEALSKDNQLGELEIAGKAKDDIISALEKQVEILNKSKEEIKVDTKDEKIVETQKTVQPVENKLELEKDKSIKIKNGMVYDSKYM